jgi:hypothetical protein
MNITKSTSNDSEGDAAAAYFVVVAPGLYVPDKPRSTSDQNTVGRLDKDDYKPYIV